MTPTLLLFYIIAQNHCANTLPKPYENFIYIQCTNEVYDCLKRKESLEACVLHD